MTLSEYLTESILSKKTGQYSHIKMTENEIRKGIIDHLYVEITDELYGESEEEIVHEMMETTHGECLWAEFVDEDSGAIIYLLSCRDNQVGKLVFDSGHPVYGRIYEKKGRKVEIVTENVKETLKYYERWIKYEPF